MTDRKAAEEWVASNWSEAEIAEISDGDANSEIRLAFLAGQEQGEQLATKRIMRWLQLDWTIWTKDNAADAIIDGIRTEVWRGYDG